MQIACVGAGSWGTTLAIEVARSGNDVLLLARTREDALRLSDERENRAFLPGVSFPPSLRIDHDPAELANASILIIAVPTQFIADALGPIRGPVSDDDVIVVNASKGIENGTLRFPHDIISDELSIRSDQIVTLSGPSHAEEVSRGDPSALVAAGSSLSRASIVRDLFASERMRIYITTDVTGVEVAGALKNVIALCAGIVDGLELGDNTKAALLTRGLAEITRLGVSLGAQAETFSGLSGLGDLVVTCTSTHSRNRHVGERIGRGESLPEIESSMEMVAEGVATTRSAVLLAEKQGIELPIIEQVSRILFDGKDAREAISDLMTRDATRE